ncbi:ATP-binding protein [Nocardia sp. NPDC059177]|uniref:ATP-binding protein n=1 Tax=Nocardia sp. NPDC059177 TaxID=3346759 RepID=UPI003687247F
MAPADVTYLPRVVDDELNGALRRIGAVLVEGPKACGKTLTATRVARTVVRLDDESGSVREVLDVDPALLLQGKTPVLLDEWQAYPPLWNLVRRAVDDRQAKGQFILTGSATPDDDVRRHTGAGRFAVIRMRPMSLYETGHSTGQVCLAAMFDGEPPRAFDPVWTATSAREQIAELIAVGGWPVNVGLDADDALLTNRDYLDVVRRYDIQRATGIDKDPEVALRVIRSFARGIATPMAETTIAKDIRGGEPSETGPDATSRDAVRAHLDALRRLRLVEDQPAWGPSIRSARRLQTSPKRHFVDPSLAVAALQTGVAPLAADVKTLGLLFESLAVRDLRVYSQPLGGHVSHYRDDKHLEVDAIVELRDGRWGAFEIKLGAEAHVIDSAAENLKKMAELVDDNRCAFLAVLTNGGMATRRRDGVDVVPLRMLAP